MDQVIAEGNRNPWMVSSIFDFHYFCCPECHEKSKTKQEFIKHAYNFHNSALEGLRQIRDGSLADIDVVSAKIIHSSNTEETINTKQTKVQNLSKTYNGECESKTKENGHNTGWGISFQIPKTCPFRIPKWFI